jgi:hypothetical protein
MLRHRDFTRRASLYTVLAEAGLVAGVFYVRVSKPVVKNMHSCSFLFFWSVW